MIHCSRKTLDTSVIFQWRLWVFFLKVSSSLSDGSYSPQGQMNFFPFCAKVWKPTGLSFSFLWCEVYQEHNILISYFSGKIFSWLPKRVFPSCRKKKKKTNIPNNLWVDQGRAEHLFQKQFKRQQHCYYHSFPTSQWRKSFFLGSVALLPPSAQWHSVDKFTGPLGLG